MCGNEAKVTNKRFDGNFGNLYTRDFPHSNIFSLFEYHLFYLEVNLMPYCFLLFLKDIFVLNAPLVVEQDAPEAIISAQLSVKNSFVTHLVAQSEKHLSVAMATLFLQQ